MAGYGHFYRALQPGRRIPLGTIFENLPGVTVELERLPHSPQVIPYFWVRGAKAGDIEGGWDCRNGRDYPDWDVLITEVEKSEPAEE